MAVQTQIQTRRGTAATWTSTNPTLAAGEIGFESDTGKFKIGTGSTAWASLAYAANLSPLTTKGDLYTYSTDNTRLAVGNNGETIVADSSTSTGLRYTAGTVQANPILNSAMQIAQRGTSFSTAAAASAYTLDRWLVRSYAAGMANTVTQQSTNDTTNLPFIQYCARIQRNSGQTGASGLLYEQGLETINSRPFAGKTVTLSFYARAGANYSATSNLLTTQIVTGTGTDQMPASYTGSVAQQQTHTLTTTWQRFSQTVTLAATTTEFGLGFIHTTTGTAGANDYFELTGVQIDIGSVALPFSTYAGTIQGELAACQRYYFRQTVNTTGGGQFNPGIAGSALSTTIVDFNIKLPTTMRVTPTAIEAALAAVYDWRTSALHFSGTFFLYAGTPDFAVARYTHGSAVFAINDYCNWVSTGSGSMYVGFTAEL